MNDTNMAHPDITGASMQMGAVELPPSERQIVSTVREAAHQTNDDDALRMQLRFDGREQLRFILFLIMAMDTAITAEERLPDGVRHAVAHVLATWRKARRSSGREVPPTWAHFKQDTLVYPVFAEAIMRLQILEPFFRSKPSKNGWANEVALARDFAIRYTKIVG